MFNSYWHSSRSYDDEENAQSCDKEAGEKFVMKWGFIPSCEPSVSYKCEDMGYVKCGGLNIGCGKNHAECADAIIDMITSTASGIAKFVTNVVLPGGGYLLNVIRLIADVISAVGSAV